jgi:signal transduction histidine kinase
VAGEETLLARLVENLIDNAVRHNERGGWVDASVEAAGGLCKLTIENGGERLDERKVQELARPFRRLVADRTGARDGFGLGLSIVAAIASAHDGRLELQGRASGGLSAVIYLPLAVAAEVTTEA